MYFFLRTFKLFLVVVSHFAVLVSYHQSIWADLETPRAREARIKFAAACLFAHVPLEEGCAECTYFTLPL